MLVFAIATAMIMGRGPQRGIGLVLFGLIAIAYPKVFPLVLMAVGFIIAKR